MGELRRESPALRGRVLAEVVGTSGAAALVLVLLLRVYGQPGAARSPGATWLFAFFVLLGELVPVHVLRRGDGGETTIATPFAIGLILTSDVVDATVLLAASTVLAGLVRQRASGDIGARAARYALGLALAGAVFHALDARVIQGVGTVDELLAITVAGAAFFV